jgi:hypothetical protein
MPTVIDISQAPPEQVLPKLQPSPAFVAYYDPKRWCVPTGSGRLVPDLVQHPIEPGYGPVGFYSHGKFGQAVDLVAASLRKSGCVQLPLSDMLDGVQYIRKDEVYDADSRRNSARYGWVWDKLTPGSERVGVDVEIRDQWLAHWRARGLIPAAPPEDVIVTAIADLERQHANILRNNQGRDVPDARLVEAELKVWRAALTAEPAPTEKAQKSKKAKTPAIDLAGTGADVQSGFAE